MVRANKVEHPSQWQWCGYNEIQKPRRRNVIIDYQKLIELSGFKSYDEFQSAHKSWIEHSLTSDKLKRESHWTQSIATGSQLFVKEIHSKLGIRAKSKHIEETKDGYQICEEVASYNSLFDAEKEVIEGKNSLFWNENC
jgi:putative transposase